VEKPDVAFLKANRTETTATWIGHATVLLQTGGVNVLTDPHLTERASPVGFAGPRRYVPPALDFHELPHVHIVVISHNHYDHLDRETVVRLAKQPGGSPRFFVGLGLARWFRDQGIDDVVEMDWWDFAEHAGARVHFVPVQHWSQRTLWDRNRTLWGGWVIEKGSFRFYFGGDAGYSRDYADVGQRFGGFDLAALPIGAYAPRWFMKTHHIDPDEAYQAYRDLRARDAMAIHWGTFVLTDEPFEEPAQRLAAIVATSNPGRFHVYRHGETRTLR
jgi:L-ascorbate metabolism protein UlaG (beta-lactamase superfamily)